MERIKHFLRYNAWVVVLDILTFVFSYLLALYIRFFSDGQIHLGQQYINCYWTFIPFTALASVIVFAFFRLYGAMWQYAGIHDLNRIIKANIVTTVLHVVISMTVIALSPAYKEYASRMPISYYILGGMIQFGATALVRFINRFYRAEQHRVNRKYSVRVMLVGTGETARIVRRQIEDDLDSAARIICFFTYHDSEIGTLINGIPVVGDLNRFKEHITEFKIQRVILADTLMPYSMREQITAACRETDTELQNLSGFLRYDNNTLPFQQLMECVDGKLRVCLDGKTTLYDNGEQALMAINGRHEVKSVSVYENALFVELVSYKVQPLIVFYITNRPDVALVAERYGVDRIWVDLETRGKEERQRNLNTVKSRHSISDISAIKQVLHKAEMLVRVNPWYEGSQAEIDAVIQAGADIIMLPYWKTPGEVASFIKAVGGRCKTTLLLETKEAVDCVDEVLKMGGFDEIHIGLNDLHLSYGMSFMFEPLANGIVETLCQKFKAAGIPYGFGGIAQLGSGMLPAEKIIMEHYRLGSTRAILSRSFCDAAKIDSIEEIERIFSENMEKLRQYELSMADVTQEEFVRNKMEVIDKVDEIAERIFKARSQGL